MAKKKGLDISSKSISLLSKRKKNIFVWIGVFGIIFAFIAAIYNGIDMKSAIKAENAKHKMLQNPNLKNDINTSSETKISWAINMENTVENMKKEQKKIVTEMANKTKQDIVHSNGVLLDEIKKSNAIVKGKLKEIYDENLKLKKELSALKEKTSSNIKQLQTKIKTTQNMIEDGVMLPPPPLKSDDASSKTDSGGLFSKLNINAVVGNKPTKKIKKINYEVVSYANTFKDENNTKKTDENLTKEQIKARNTYSVTTGFTDAYMVTGAYVPLFQNGGGGAGGAPQSVPVLFETNGDLIMANNTAGSIDKCFVLGNSQGNPGARTIDIRLDKMTCLLEDGEYMLQGSIDGYIVSETGTPGLPATMIYKAGDFISRMIGAGILEGLTTTLTNYAAGYNNNGVGGTQIYGGAMTGASDGMNNAFSKLADFYLQLAEATIPILEAKPGRFVSMVLVGGNDFELKKVNLLNVNDAKSYVDQFIGDK